MPAAYLHETVAKRAETLLHNQGIDTTIIKHHQDAFLIGSQGPDPLFFYRILDPFTNFDIMRFGEKIHKTSTGKFLTALVRHAKDNDITMAYVSGWLSHYATDCIFHPYVRAMSHRWDRRRNSIEHGFLEHALDTWIYRKTVQDGVPRQVEALETISESDIHAIASVIVATVRDVFPDQEFEHKHVFDSFRSMNGAIRKLYSPNGKKYRFLSCIEKLFGAHGLVTSHTPPFTLPDNDFINANKTTWYTPDEKKRERIESADELFMMAADRSKKYITVALSYWRDKCKLDTVSSLIGNISYSNGLPL